MNITENNNETEVMNKIIYFHKNVFYKEYTNCVILYNVFDFEHKMEMSNFVVKIFHLINGENKLCDVVDKFYLSADFTEKKYDIKTILIYLIEKEFLTFEKSVGYIAQSNQKMPLLDLVNLRITNKCNYKCIHCFPDAEIYSEEFSTEYLLDIIDNLAEYKVVHLTLTGGEPFLNKDLIKIVQYANLKGIVVSICSNASLITDEIIEKLKKCSLGALKISLDGPTALEHDKYRGNGKFDKAIPKIKKIIGNGIPVCINTVFSRINCSVYKEMANLISELKPKEFAFDFIRYSGRAKDNWDELELTDSEKIKIIQYFNQFGTKMNGITLGSDIFTCVIKSSFDKNAEDLSCGICINNIVILSDGTVVPCWRLHDVGVSCGNLHETSFDEIWSNSDVLKKVRTTKTSELEKCGSCNYNRFCDASCRAFALQEHDNWFGPPNSKRCKFEHLKINNLLKEKF